MEQLAIDDWQVEEVIDSLVLLLHLPVSNRTYRMQTYALSLSLSFSICVLYLCVQIREGVCGIGNGGVHATEVGADRPRSR